MEDHVQDKRTSARPEIRIRLVGETPFFGPGTARLLEEVVRCGSVYRACEALDLSYSKGRRMLREVERQLGQPAVLCTKGGAGGGNARLTDAGRNLLAQYDCYEQDVRSYAEERFARYFPPQEALP